MEILKRNSVSRNFLQAVFFVDVIHNVYIIALNRDRRIITENRGRSRISR
jgi:hypothetical protein